MDIATKCQTHNAQRLIDVYALKEAWKDVAVDGATLSYIYGLFKSVDDAPTIDAVEVVRCKDCQHANECHKSVQYTRNEPNTVTIGYLPIEWCSRGERSEE